MRINGNYSSLLPTLNQKRDFSAEENQRYDNLVSKSLKKLERMQRRDSNDSPVRLTRNAEAQKYYNSVSKQRNPKKVSLALSKSNSVLDVNHNFGRIPDYIKKYNEEESIERMKR